MIQKAESISPLQIDSQLLHLGNTPHQESQRFLKFPLNSEINCLLPLGELQGVVNVALKDILPVPQVAEFFLGIINWRGKATWIVDLANLLGAPHWCRREPIPKSGMAMLIQVKSETVGLLVEQVNAIETYNPQQCLPVSEAMFSPQLRSFLKSYCIDSQGKPWMMLDIQAMIQVIT